MATRSLATFTLARASFGVPVERVQEVLPPQPITPIPRTPPVVCGLINLRGDIVTVLDPRRSLELEARTNADRDDGTAVLVLRIDAAPLGLLVDEIGDIVVLEDELFERPPETLRGAARELISGAYKLPERLLLLLDVGKMLELARRLAA